MPDVIPEELAWLEASIAVVQALAAQAATARLLASLGDGRPLTPASLAAWSAEVRETAKADRAAARDGLQASAKRVAARMFVGNMNDAFEITETHPDGGGGSVDIATRLSERVSDVGRLRGVRTNVHSHQASGIPGATPDRHRPDPGRRRLRRHRAMTRERACVLALQQAKRRRDHPRNGADVLTLRA